MTQPTMFDLVNPEPASDPTSPWTGRSGTSRATSRAAAQSVDHSAATLREVVYEAVRRAGFGLTDEEGIAKTGMAPNTYRPRRIELVDAGRLRDSGITRRTVAGRSATVWEVIR